MYKLSYEDLLKKCNSLLKTNIAMAKSLSGHNQTVSELNYKIEKLELIISDLKLQLKYAKDELSKYKPEDECDD